MARKRASAIETAVTQDETLPDETFVIMDMYWSDKAQRFFPPDIGGERARSKDFAGPIRCRVSADERGNEVIVPVETQPETNDALGGGMPEETEDESDGDANPDLSFGSG